MTVNIPEEPDDISIKPVLDCMELCDRQTMRVGDTNKFDVVFYNTIRFKDDTTALSPIMTTTAAKRLFEGGETLVFKVIKNRLTPDAPLNFNYCGPDLEFRPPVGPFRQLT